MKNLFNQDYFENGVAAGVSCYRDYRWLPELTIPMAKAIVSHLGLRGDQLILDFGCAKGYLVKALRMLGYDAHGADVSEYAVNQADEFTRPFLQLIEPGAVVPPHQAAYQWSWIIAKDVLEHLTEDEVRAALRMFRDRARCLFVVVPLGDGTRYVIPQMEQDVTHKIRQPLEWWSRAIIDAGFNECAGSYEVPGIKDNWTSVWPKGNGFLVAR